ncbi:PREDICTED: erythroblast NAD(P)(+)--arginine ADP-ribosyltransferase-like [Calidris pugnax]|uniref:erythroblast NAD(P)(+)--arginine ADP-ribosyltransferase-like n=1 Tax=Calidris pugnax TaxID=198806 RepID=UPI00071D88D5|nr:PREDICTED: erythroblast NAD(P)(+)--arginine ADP-ribosyltransferase-like [Calidris pugnax]
MSMEHLVLLLAGSPATINLWLLQAVEKVLDMAPTSFNDQYQGCSPKMEEELGELNNTEFTNNSIYAKYWTQAADNWQNQEGCVPQPLVLWTEHTMALTAYPLQEGLYKEFNRTVCEAGCSCRKELDKFHFKETGFVGEVFGALQGEALEKELEAPIVPRDAHEGGKGLAASFGSDQGKPSKDKKK